MEDSQMSIPSTDSSISNASRSGFRSLSSSRYTLDLKLSPEMFIRMKSSKIDDHYLFVEKIGEGGYGEVWKALHRVSQNIRAVKKIFKAKIPPEEKDKFLTEINILKELDHPNIVRVYDVFVDDEFYYLVIQYCSGGELFDRMRKSHLLNEKHCAEWIRQILSALAYCHSKGIIHTDIKPENLIFNSPEKDSHLKVIDFGTSCRIKEGEKLHLLYGTLCYLAPEVLRDEVDEKCDIWSTGIILYRLLVGSMPFSCEENTELIKEIMTFNPIFREELKGLSIEARDLLTKMLEPDPSKRISAREALNHEWLVKNASLPAPCVKILNNLKNFRPKSVLKQTVMTYISWHSSSDIEHLQESFYAIDVFGYGAIEETDLLQAYLKIGMPFQEARETAASVMSEVDLNNSGFIDFNGKIPMKFAMAARTTSELVTRKSVEDAFKSFDSDQDGYLLLSDIQKMMNGISIDDTQWATMFAEIDANGDGKISKQEFMNYMFDTNKADWWYIKYKQDILSVLEPF